MSSDEKGTLRFVAMGRVWETEVGALPEDSIAACAGCREETDGCQADTCQDERKPHHETIQGMPAQGEQMWPGWRDDERSAVLQRHQEVCKNFGELQDQYRDLFGIINQAALSVGQVAVNGHDAAKLAVRWLAEDLKETRGRLKSLTAHANQVTAERDRLQAEIELRRQGDIFPNGQRMMMIRPSDYDTLVTAESEKERILAKLKLKSGTPVEIVLDTIQSLEHHAACWRTHNRDMANGDRLIAKPEYDRLLAIERGHQADAATARSAKAQLKEVTDALGLPEGRDTRSVVAEINKLHSDRTHLKAISMETQERCQAAYANLAKMEAAYLRSHNEVESLKESNSSLEKELSDAANKNGALRAAHEEQENLIAALERKLAILCDTHNVEWQPTVNDPGLADQNNSLKEQLALIRAALTRAGIQRIVPEHAAVTKLATRSVNQRATIDGIARNLNLPNPDEATREEIMDAISALQHGQMQGRYMALGRKLATLRNIVQRKAPHTSDCTRALIERPYGTIVPCGCWKAEFMAEADKA